MTKPTTLFNRHFILLWQGQFVSQLGNQLHAIALMFWIKHTTGSASLMGMVLMVSMLPGIVLGPIGGTFADRFSRRWTIIICDFLRGVLILTFAFLIFTVKDANELLIIWLFVISVLVGICGAFFRPAISAAIPDLVPTEKVSAANSMNQSSIQVAGFLGQGLGGVLYRVLGGPMLFLIDGLTYIFSAVSECFIKIPQVMPEKSKDFSTLINDFKAETKEGFNYVWSRKGMRNMFIVAAFLNFILAPFGVLLPFYVEDYLNCTPDWFGYMLALFGVGALLGYLFAGVIKVSGRTRAVLVQSFLVLCGLLLAALYFTSNRWMAAGLFTLFGALTGVVNINIMTILQVTTASEIRGRVFGLLGTLAMGLAPLSMGLTGVIADLLDQNIPLIYLCSGILTTLVTLTVGLDRHFREFLAYEPPTGESTEQS
jgi:MFS family permease